MLYKQGTFTNDKATCCFLLCGFIIFSGFAFMFYHENASSPEEKKREIEEKKAEVQAIREQYQQNNPDWNPNDEDGGPNDEKGGSGRL